MKPETLLPLCVGIDVVVNCIKLLAHLQLLQEDRKGTVP
jgi:hypothetical protein